MRVFIFVGLFCGNCWALEPLKPVSESYRDLIRCFPELSDEAISSKVDLNKLRELIDEKFISSKSQLRERQVSYIDADNQAKRLTLRAKNPTALKVDYVLTLEKVDEKGLYSDIKIPEAQRINPKQEILNGFLSGATVQADQYVYVDTKLNGLSSVLRRNLKEVEEIDLRDPNGGRSVLCEKQKELGIICTCSKK